jgi:hypothetical protein
MTVSYIYPEMKTLKNIYFKHFILFVTYEFARNIECFNTGKPLQHSVV